MATLEVSNRTINFDGRILNLRTVTSICKMSGKTPRPKVGKKMLYTVILLFAFLAFGTTDSGQKIGPAGAVLCGGFLLFFVNLLRKPRQFWVLHLQTAAGANNVLASRDEYAVDEAIGKIRAALESDVAFHSTLNIADSTIVNDSIVQNSTLSNMRH